MEFIYKLLNQGHNIVAIVHGDTHKQQLNRIKHRATLIIELIQSKNQIDKFYCKTLSMRNKMKLLLHQELYSVIDGNIIKESNVSFIPQNSITSINESPSSSYPTTNEQQQKNFLQDLPFKLDLSDKEKKDREKVILPYENVSTEEIQSEEIEDPDYDLDI